MARITVEDCLQRIDNRFELVLMATRRARQLERGAEATVPVDGDKPAVIALREIAGNTIDAPTIDNIEREYQEREARKAIEWAASEWREDDEAEGDVIGATRTTAAAKIAPDNAAATARSVTRMPAQDAVAEPDHARKAA